LNVTTSISDEDAAQRARVYFSFYADKAPPVAVFLCSDGVDDNYPVQDNERHLYKLYREAALAFANDGFDSACKQIADLARAFATKGKGDDTSIAGIVDMDGIKRAAREWRRQIDAGEEDAAKTAHDDAPAPPSESGAHLTPAAPSANFERRPLHEITGERNIKAQNPSIRAVAALAVFAALVAVGVIVLGGVKYRRLYADHTRLNADHSRAKDEVADLSAKLREKSAEADGLRLQNEQLQAPQEPPPDSADENNQHEEDKE
jgi:hypothetical protein